MRSKSVYFSTITLLISIGVGIQGGIVPDAIKDQAFKIYKNVALEVRDIKYDPITEDKVQYFLFTKESPSEYIRLDPYHLERFTNATCKIAILIHGWTNSREIQWYEDVKNALLNRQEEFCVVQIDWNEPANQLYTVASISTYDVAKYVAQFVIDLHQNCSIPLERFLLVGHSLGGQITGFVGKRVLKSTGHKLPRIIALDPAGPLFSHRPKDKRLNEDDAEVVHVIHTNGGVFGYSSPIGTIDFFPNGGSSQPGCKRVDLGDLSSIISEPVSCDHRRAWAYFSEAVLNPKSFLARQCSDWKNFTDNSCDKLEVAMGNLTTNERGMFFLETNKDKPFAKRPRGANVLGVLKLLQH